MDFSPNAPKISNGALAYGITHPTGYWRDLILTGGGAGDAPLVNSSLSAEVLGYWMVGNNGCCGLFWIKLFAFIHIQVNSVSLQ